jgi:hypothetical protein
MLISYGNIKLNKYNRVTRKLTKRDSEFPLSLFNMLDRSEIVCSLLPLSTSFVVMHFFEQKKVKHVEKNKRY